MVTKAIRGSCLCSNVKYEIKPPFIKFHYCHCPRCRKHTGSSNATNLFVDSDNFRWIEGQNSVKRFDLPDARCFARCFCNKCGSPVPHHSKPSNYMVVPAGSLHDDPGLSPQCSIFWDFKASWFRDFNDIPKYAEYPPDKK